MGHNFDHLAEEIIRLSQAKNWNEAKKEWGLDSIYFADGAPRTCACTHNPIYEICIIANTETGEKLEVGNICVKHFMPELESAVIFAGIKGLVDKRRIPKGATLARLRMFGAITENEEMFLLNIKKYQRKRWRITERQTAWLNDIIMRIGRLYGRTPQ